MARKLQWVTLGHAKVPLRCLRRARARRRYQRGRRSRWPDTCFRPRVGRLKPRIPSTVRHRHPPTARCASYDLSGCGGWRVASNPIARARDALPRSSRGPWQVCRRGLGLGRNAAGVAVPVGRAGPTVPWAVLARCLGSEGPDGFLACSVRGLTHCFRTGNLIALREFASFRRNSCISRCLSGLHASADIVASRART
jgi:hypothetical protein